MKNSTFGFLAGTVAMLISAPFGTSLVLAQSEKHLNVVEVNNEPFAVVELFTSEGCSSCPPADALLGKIENEERKSEPRIYPISWHVDYWDRLGWKDPFSSSRYSQRQRDYVKTMNLRSSYTPQMVVNGQTEFVGSSESEAREAISESLKTKTTTGLGIDLGGEGHTVIVNYQIEGDAKGKKLNIVLVEKDLQIEVPRGENSGRTLKHENVARVFLEVYFQQDEESGSATLEIPTGVNVQKSEVIAFLQDQQDLRIVAADAEKIAR